MADRSSPPALCAVLTGDVVDSSHLTAETRRRLPEMLRRVGAELRKTWPAAVPSPINVFRGDSWQLLILAPALALRLAIFFRSGLIAFSTTETLDTRISLAIGRVDFVPGKITEGDGPAYRASGQNLDEMSDHIRLHLNDLSQTLPALQIVAPLLDAIIQGWTPRQAQAVQSRLRGWNQQKISERFLPTPITQQSVARHLKAAHWEAIAQVLTRLESDWSLAHKS